MAAAAWPEAETDGVAADADDRHDRVDDGVPVPVAVPARVLAVSVAVEPDRVEDLVVALTQGVAHRGEDRQRLRTAAVGASTTT